MISDARIKLAVNSKVGWLTAYYKNKLNTSEEKAYCYVRDSGIIDILNDKNTRLYLESVDLVKDAIDIYYKSGKSAMTDYLMSNIG